MMSTNTDDLRIQNLRELVVPEALIAELPAEGPLAEHVNASREVIQTILERTDDRLVVVVGPCSIHDPDAAMDYAARLKTLADEVSEDIFVVMRVYFEKPRTTVGWKGLITTPTSTTLLMSTKACAVRANCCWISMAWASPPPLNIWI